MLKNHGHSIAEILAVFTVLIFASIAIALAQQPNQKLHEYRDQERQEDLRNILEEVLFLKETDEEAYAAILAQSAAGRSMIGMENLCPDSYGEHCMDSDMRDVCLQLGDWAPIDPYGAFSEHQTGYYLELRGDMLVAGACSPDIAEVLEMEVDIGI